jgi:hypothetical protein
MEQKVIASIEKQLVPIFTQRFTDGIESSKGAPKRKLSIRNRMGKVDNILAGFHGDKGRVLSVIRHLLTATFQDGYDMPEGKTIEDYSGVIAGRIKMALKSCADCLAEGAPVGRVGAKPLVKEKYALAKGK